MPPWYSAAPPPLRPPRPRWGPEGAAVPRHSPGARGAAGAGAARSSCPAASGPRFCELKAVRAGKPLPRTRAAALCLYTQPNVYCVFFCQNASCDYSAVSLVSYFHVITSKKNKKENASQADRSGAALDVNVWESHAWSDSTRQSSNPHAGFFSEEIRK